MATELCSLIDAQFYEQVQSGPASTRKLSSLEVFCLIYLFVQSQQPWTATSTWLQVE